MDTLTRQHLESLAGNRSLWCVSIYVPTDRTANGMLQNPIRLKNLISQAEAMLVDHGLRGPEARDAVEPLKELLADKKFWTGIAEGLAVFLDSEGLRAYRLPLRFEELVFVGKRFHIKPLLAVVAGDEKFFLLAFSANSVRLYEGNRWRLKELPVPEMPENMREALHYDQREVVRQAHTATAGGRYGTQMSFHGQGGSVDVAKDERQEFLRLVDHALARHLTNERAPLVFAGVDYLFPMFSKLCSYSHLVPGHIAANTDAWNTEKLHAAAWPVVAPLFKQEQDDAVARSRRAAGTDYCLLQLDRVLQACSQGQADTLLVDPDKLCWGTFDATVGAMHLDDQPMPGNEELLDLAVTLTLAGRGKVFLVSRTDLPDQSPVVALLRYPSTATPIPQMQKG